MWVSNNARPPTYVRSLSRGARETTLTRGFGELQVSLCEFLHSSFEGHSRLVVSVVSFVSLFHEGKTCALFHIDLLE